MDRLQQIREDMTRTVHEAHACKESYRAMLDAKDFVLFCEVIRKYWGSMMEDFREDTFRFFERYGSEYGKELAAQGIHYNADCEEGIALLNKPSEHPYRIGGEAEAWVFNGVAVEAYGHAHIILHGECTLHAGEGVRVQQFEK